MTTIWHATDLQAVFPSFLTYDTEYELPRTNGLNEPSGYSERYMLKPGKARKLKKLRTNTAETQSANVRHVSARRHTAY